MAKFVISGASGFLGRNLVDSLLSRGDDILVIVRNVDYVFQFWGDSVDYFEYDLSSDLSGLSIPYDLQGSTVIHFAWSGTSGEERADENIQLNNISMACRFMRTMKSLGSTRFINAGSIMEYEAKEFVPIDGYVPSRNMIYSVSKMSVDYLLKVIAADIGIEYVNIIISNIYGPGENSKRFMNNLVRKLKSDVAIELTEGNQLYDFIFITDAVDMIIEVSKRGRSFESYYIGNARQRRLKEFVIEAKEVLNSNSALLFGAVPLIGPNLEFTEFDCEKIEREFGIYSKIKFSDGIKKLAESIMEE